MTIGSTGPDEEFVRAATSDSVLEERLFPWVNDPVPGNDIYADLSDLRDDGWYDDEDFYDDEDDDDEPVAIIGIDNIVRYRQSDGTYVEPSTENPDT